MSPVALSYTFAAGSLLLGLLICASSKSAPDFGIALVVTGLGLWLIATLA